MIGVSLEKDLTFLTVSCNVSGVRRNSPSVGFMAAAPLDHPLDLHGWPYAPSFAAIE